MAARRLRALHEHLCLSPSAAVPSLEDLELPSVMAPFRYFDFERFRAVHGSDAKPWGDARKPEFREQAERLNPEGEAADRTRLAEHFNIVRKSPVLNARSVPDDAFVFDEFGVKLYQAPTKMTDEDFYHREPTQHIYFPECVELVKKATGATRVIPFDYIVRNRLRPEDAAGYAAAGSAGSPHNDWTLVSAPRRVRELLGEDPVHDEILKHRFQVTNVWRRWDGGNEWPLCCSLWNTFEEYHRDMVGVDLHYEHRTGEVYRVRFNEARKYYWWKDMTRDEAILLKVYDSQDGVAQGSIHGAFENPHADPTGPPRMSMEVRCIVLFGPEELTAQAHLRDGQASTNVGGLLRGNAGAGQSVRGLVDPRSTPQH